MKFENRNAAAISTTVGAIIIIVIIIIVGVGVYAATRPSSTTTTTSLTNTTSTTTSPIIISSSTTTTSTTITSISTTSTKNSSTTATSSSTTTTGTGTGTGEQVIIPQGAASGKNFDPSSITITAGTTITFVDQDSLAPHNVWFTGVPSGATNPNTAAGQSSQYEILQGQSVSYTLTTPGTYTYECQFHSSWMQGTIIVTS